MQRYDRPHTFQYCDPPYWQTYGYGVDFGIEQYERMAEFMRTCQGKVMVSINDHPDIRRVFEGFTMMELDIKYAIGNVHGQPSGSKELVITNWNADVVTQLF
jgi:DNA adenine methylase